MTHVAALATVVNQSYVALLEPSSRSPHVIWAESESGADERLLLNELEDLVAGYFNHIHRVPHRYRLEKIDPRKFQIQAYYVVNSLSDENHGIVTINAMGEAGRYAIHFWHMPTREEAMGQMDHPFSEGERNAFLEYARDVGYHVPEKQLRLFDES